MGTSQGSWPVATPQIAVSGGVAPQVAKPEISHYDGQESNGGERRGGRTARYE